MNEKLANEGMISDLLLGTIKQEIKIYLVDCQARDLSKNTIIYYRHALECFTAFLEARQVYEVNKITANDIRAYLICLGEKRSRGGVHAVFRAIRAFCYWWEDESESGWNNPIKRVKVKPPPVQPIQGAKIDEIKQMLKYCEGRDAIALRALVDTGARATEFCSIRLTDIDLSTGAITLNNTKGGQIRTVYLGRVTLREVVRYLRKRPSSPWFISRLDGRQLSREGLADAIEKVAKLAGIPVPSPHDFRRCCALTLLRNGMDLLSVSRYLGHKTLDVTRRYLAQAESDISNAHSKASPGDML